MQPVLAHLLRRMESHRESGEIMPATVMYKATTSDIITKFAYGTSAGNLSKQDYNVGYFSGVDKLYDFSNINLYLPWLGPLMESLPLPIMSKLVPELVPFLAMQNVSCLPFDEDASSS